MSDLLYKQECFNVVGVAMEVMNNLGHGYNEKPYENAMVVEFKIRNIPFVQQPQFPLQYKGVTIGNFIPDLIAYSQIIIDTKTIKNITDHERGQMLNYLRATQYRVGLIINFFNPKLEWERIVL
ncbi:MAG TPA: GxxExxY protein [Kiritimatiellia bacterium]|nr:GxxExxY protein [Kiritimatiellia bacterium]HMO99123.1 GxxExxY protein [Kiritimatiellia bacterium]HMP95699.1 GxxExxY protein [Kiritimatiellia bacterium]